MTITRRTTEATITTAAPGAILIINLCYQRPSAITGATPGTTAGVWDTITTTIIATLTIPSGVLLICRTHSVGVTATPTIIHTMATVMAMATVIHIKATS